MSLHEHAEARSKHSATTLGKVAELLEKNGIGPEDVGRVERIRINEYQGLTKNAEGEAEVHNLQASSILISPKWAEGPEWPVIEPAKPMIIRPPKLGRPPKTGRKTAVILPDIQIGYYRDTQGKLHPTHDEAALGVALQIVRTVRPDDVVMVGDNLDFPELGKYRKHHAFVQTTQPAIDRAGELMGQIRAAAGDEAEIFWLAGNHEERLPNYIQDNASAAFGLKAANSPPEAWPLLTVKVLCRLDEVGVTFLPGYPANEHYLNDRLQVIHGERVSANSSTVHKLLQYERVSTICGHIHRREWAERTRRTRYGPRTILAASPGCLCRIDGKVPSTKSGHDQHGQPLKRYEDWQQGLAIVHYVPGDGPFTYEPIAIHDGSALFRGKVYGRAQEEL